MNGKKVALGLTCAPLLLIVVILTLVLGGGGGTNSASTSHVLGNTELKDGAVPSWALQPIKAAAATCSEITAPILAAQIETESNWNPNAHNDSSGADGLAQFIPSTWTKYGTDGDGDGKAEPRDPADAIATQAVYMCRLVDLVKNSTDLTGEIVDLALAAYNAGPGNVQKFGGIPPFPETTNYVTKIRNLANTKYANVTTVSSGSGRAEPIIQKASEHVKKTPYAWGSGTLDGPSGGTSPDQGVVGFDCSSLVRYAYYQGTSQTVTLPRTAQAQYDATKSQPIAVSDLQPGDLLFWGSPSNIHHVALYIGNNRMIEAPESGELVTDTDIRTKGDYVGATRVFGGPLDIVLSART